MHGNPRTREIATRLVELRKRNSLLEHMPKDSLEQFHKKVTSEPISIKKEKQTKFLKKDGKFVTADLLFYLKENGVDAKPENVAEFLKNCALGTVGSNGRRVFVNKKELRQAFFKTRNFFTKKQRLLALSEKIAKKINKSPDVVRHALNHGIRSIKFMNENIFSYEMPSLLNIHASRWTLFRSRVKKELPIKEVNGIFYFNKADFDVVKARYWKYRADAKEKARTAPRTRRK